MAYYGVSLSRGSFSSRDCHGRALKDYDTRGRHFLKKLPFRTAGFCICNLTESSLGVVPRWQEAYSIPVYVYFSETPALYVLKDTFSVYFCTDIKAPLSESRYPAPSSLPRLPLPRRR